jgi:class 3 adenylate cyclase
LRRAAIRDFQDVATEAVARFDGHIAKFVGDGILVYFGWPGPTRTIRSELAAIPLVGNFPHVRARRC